jgi:hypothetical protein
MKHYFKYKSLKGDSFKYFVKMLVESKMYAAKFSELNDPMEGAYLSDEEVKGYFNIKEDQRIISLIKKNGQEMPCNMLMWSHYSDEHKGCCIEFHFVNKEDEEETLPIEYVEKIKAEGVNSIQKILRRKFIDWKYEQEVRYIGSEKLVSIEIDRIYLGMRIDNMYGNDTSEEVFLRELINRINPKSDGVKMCAEDFDGHHLDTLKD